MQPYPTPHTSPAFSASNILVYSEANMHVHIQNPTNLDTLQKRLATQYIKARDAFAAERYSLAEFHAAAVIRFGRVGTSTECL
jgi:hypothetical protein